MVFNHHCYQVAAHLFGILTPRGWMHWDLDYGVDAWNSHRTMGQEPMESPDF